MKRNICTLSLEDENGGVLAGNSRILNHLIAFIFSNPGNTCEYSEAVMGSLGKLSMEHGEDPDALAAAYTTMIQGCVDRTFGTGVYHVSVSAKGVDAINTVDNLTILVVDTNGNNALDAQYDVTSLLTEQTGAKSEEHKSLTE